MKKKIILLLTIVVLAFSGCKSAVEEAGEFLTEQRFEEAIEQYNASIEAGDELAESFRGLGICYFEQEQYEDALKALEQSLNEGAEVNAIIYNLCGICAMKTDDVSRAVYYFEEGQRFDDASEELRQEMAFNVIVCYEELDEYELAKEAAQKYIDNYPDDERAAKELEFLETQS